MPAIRSIACLPAAHRFSQDDALRLMERWFSMPGAQPALSMEKMKAVFRNSGVEHRHCAVPIEELLPDKPLSVKNELFISAAKELAFAAAERALRDAGLDAMEIDMIISTSCTGFMIPAVDAYLMNRMKFRSDVKRLPITELGCAAGVAALRIASDFIKAYPCANVLVVSVEFPVLTFQPSDYSADHLVSCAIFGDGGAAMVIGGEHECGLEVETAATHFFPDTINFMGYDLKETGFHIFLSRKIPGFIESTLMPELRRIFASIDPEGSIRTWLVHPGGPKILDAVEDALGIERNGLVHSRETLRTIGNLSSATIYFVIASYLARRPMSGERCGVIAVGPGFGMDYAVLRVKP